MWSRFGIFQSGGVKENGRDALFLSLAKMETDCISHIFIGWILCQQGDPETDRKALVKNVFAAADMCGTARYLSSTTGPKRSCAFQAGQMKAGEAAAAAMVLAGERGLTWALLFPVPSAPPCILLWKLYGVTRRILRNEPKPHIAF